MVLCAAYCDKEATLDFLAMEDKPSGRYTSDLFSTGTAHIKISTQFPDSGRGVIQRRCQWRCHLPPAPPSPLPPPLPSPSSAMYWWGLLKPSHQGHPALSWQAGKHLGFSSQMLESGTRVTFLQCKSAVVIADLHCRTAEAKKI